MIYECVMRFEFYI